jgi:hypothetical protein
MGTSAPANDTRREPNTQRQLLIDKVEEISVLSNAKRSLVLIG